ncbi:MAG: galactokinase [Candidatus Poribacteria bacterium]|nr:galactokinase [Candidatus Poribacteria bacterium]
MITVRTPFRVPLGGGGTDLPSYYKNHGGFIFSVAIDKYMFHCLNQPVVDDLVRLKYTKSEVVEHIDELEHDLAAACLRRAGIEKGIEIVSMADVPAGTGMGSSGAYTVGLLQGLHTLNRDFIGLQDLAEEACDIEINELGHPCGKQDQYLAAFGGFVVLDIAKDGVVTVRRPNISFDTLRQFEQHVSIFYTGISRSAGDILSAQNTATKRDESKVVDSLHRLKEIGHQVLEAFERGDLAAFGRLMDTHWQTKKQLSGKISSGRIDQLYELGKQNGALGGKIMGAGGGGFLLFYCEDDPTHLRKVMADEGLREMYFRVDLEGTKILTNFLSHRAETTLS